MQTKITLVLALGLGVTTDVSSRQAVIDIEESSYEFEVTNRMAFRDGEDWFVSVSGTRESENVDRPIYQLWLRVAPVSYGTPVLPGEAFLTVGGARDLCVLKGEWQHGTVTLYERGALTLDMNLLFKVTGRSFSFTLGEETHVVPAPEDTIQLRFEGLDIPQTGDLDRYLDERRLECVPELRAWKSRISSLHPVSRSGVVASGIVAQKEGFNDGSRAVPQSSWLCESPSTVRRRRS